MAHLLRLHFYGRLTFLLFHFISYPFPPSAVQYKLPDRLRLQRAQSVTLKASTHVQGTSGETPPHRGSHNSHHAPNTQIRRLITTLFFPRSPRSIKKSRRV
jgi:hypothetical protein